MSGAIRPRRSAVPRAQGHAEARRVRPSTTFEQLCERAYSTISATGSPPARIAVVAPNSCASFTVTRMRSRSRGGSRCSAGVSTYTAVQPTPSCAASLAALRTVSSPPGPGPMQHSSESSVFHTRSIDFRER